MLVAVSRRKELQGQEVGGETEFVNVKQTVKLQSFSIPYAHEPVREVVSQL